MNVARIVARVALVAGGLLWVIMLFAQSTVQSYSNLTYSFTDVTSAGLTAAIPAALAIGVFVLSLFYERLSAVVLLVAAGLVIVWGVLQGWEAGLWISMMAVMVAPVVVSAVLLLLAAATQRVCELEEAK